jgi:hypothetical protein
VTGSIAETKLEETARDLSKMSNLQQKTMFRSKKPFIFYEVTQAAQVMRIRKMLALLLSAFFSGSAAYALIENVAERLPFSIQASERGFTCTVSRLVDLTAKIHDALVFSRDRLFGSFLSSAVCRPTAGHW